jgi:hypothetical protein
MPLLAALRPIGHDAHFYRVSARSKNNRRVWKNRCRIAGFADNYWLDCKLVASIEIGCIRNAKTNFLEEFKIF